MTHEEFDTALDALGWKIADFCRATDLHRNTPQRWKREGIAIPGWVPRHLGLLLELQRLHAGIAIPGWVPKNSGLLLELQRLHAAYLVPPTPPAADPPVAGE